MIIFENEKYLQEIKKNGIGATDQNAKFKITYLISDLVANSSYRKNKIISIARDLAKDYFVGLPENIVKKQLEECYENVREKIAEQDYIENHTDKVITLYESEMKTIAELKDDKLMRLAFATLILHKFTGQFFVDGQEKYYISVKSCEADIYRIAKLNDVSGTTKKKLWKELSDLGLVRYSVRTNPAWRYHPDWTAMTVFTVPFNVDLHKDCTGEKVYKRITNYDDVILYLRYWLKDENVIECIDCGCPIVKTANSKLLCSNCAAVRKKSSDNARYRRNLCFA